MKSTLATLRHLRIGAPCGRFRLLGCVNARCGESVGSPTPPQRLALCFFRPARRQAIPYVVVMRRMQASEVKADPVGYLDPQSKRPAVPHGLRSTFRQWSAKQRYHRNMSETTLTHFIGSEAEARCVITSWCRTPLHWRRHSRHDPFPSAAVLLPRDCRSCSARGLLA